MVSPCCGTLSDAIVGVMAQIIFQLTLVFLAALFPITHPSPDGHQHGYAVSECRFYARSNGWTWCAADGSKSRGAPWVPGISRFHETAWSPGISIKPTGISQLPGLHRFRGGSSSSSKDPKPKKKPSCYKPSESEGIFLNDQKGNGQMDEHCKYLSNCQTEQVLYQPHMTWESWSTSQPCLTPLAAKSQGNRRR